jgi:5'(3')-deoxyribonucleotidase
LYIVNVVGGERPSHYFGFLNFLIMSKQILHIDMDGVIADYLDEKHQERYSSHKEEGFFKELPVIDGMFEAIQILDDKYDIFFLTTAPWSSPIAWKEKREWIEDKFGDQFKKKLIMTHRKDLVYGDYLIDDRLANGAGEFRGEHIHFVSSKFKDWVSVLDYLL